MAIDTSVKVRAGFFRRWMSVKRMKELLATLEDDDVLLPNRVGNLSVRRPSHDDDQETIWFYNGWIDFNSETYEPFDEKNMMTAERPEAEGGQE